MTSVTLGTAHRPGAAEAGWIQAHGHAQIFGWLGTVGFFAAAVFAIGPRVLPGRSYRFLL